MLLKAAFVFAGEMTRRETSEADPTGDTEERIYKICSAQFNKISNAAKGKH